jgi:hypothetical protein
VEKLDTLKDSLVVWVLVDSLEAGTDSQPFLIRGGNPAARPLNSSPFPASQGWAGVWNMGSGSSDQTGSGHDALDTNAYQTTGVIGLARYFDRTNKGHFTVPFSADLGAPAVGDFQVEAWARLDTKDSAWDDVVNQGDAGFRLQRFSNTNFLAFGFTDSATGEYVGVSGTTNIADGFFHHLVGMRRGDSLLVFVDGKRDGQKHWTGKARSSTRPITIAGNGSDRFFLGLIDEVRISRSARSDDWVHLSYESQRAGSPFLSR